MVSVAVNIVNVEVSPEMVIGWMIEDDNFANAMWIDLLEYMISGRMDHSFIEAMKSSDASFRSRAAYALEQYGKMA